MKLKKSSQPVNKGAFRSGIWSAAITVAVIVLAILVNLVVRAVPTKYTEFDLSEAGLKKNDKITVKLEGEKK